jgi:SAM-dependent methyltransferase
MNALLRKGVRALRNPSLILSKMRAWAGGARHADVGSRHLWEHKRQFQIDFHRREGLMPHHRLIDIGCGTLRGGIALIDYLDPGHYTGIEARAKTLEEGRRELHDAGLAWKRPQLILQGDLGTLSLSDRADYVWAFSVLIHMSDEVLDGCLSFVAKHLAREGAFLANVNVGEEGKAGTWRGFPVMRHPAEFYERLCARHGLRCEDLGALRELGERDEGQLSRLDPSGRRMLRIRRSSG